MDTIRAERLTKDLIITGEAVALPVFPASVPILLLSLVIDVVSTITMILLTFFTLLFATYSFSFQDLIVVFSVVSAFWILVVPVVVETLTRGRSLGGLVTNTRVVRDDGGPVRLRHVLVRTLLSVFEVWSTFGCAAVLSAVISRRSKRLGDFLAGTYLVSEPVATGRLPLVMPPSLAAWASGIQVQELPTPLAVTARGFLELARQMAPTQREQLGKQLASEVAPYVYPPAPPNTHPELFLAAALVWRRDREYEQWLEQLQNPSSRAVEPWGISAE